MRDFVDMVEIRRAFWLVGATLTSVKNNRVYVLTY